jgi:hypothetical protein
MLLALNIEANLVAEYVTASCATAAPLDDRIPFRPRSH